MKKVEEKEAQRALALLSPSRIGPLGHISESRPL